MPSLYVDTDELLAGPLYAFGLLLIALPMLDFGSSIVPVHATNLQWRFATLGLLSNFLMTPMMGLCLMVVVAAVRGHRGVQRSLAIVNTLLVLMLVAALALFALDAVQLNGSVPADQAETFHSAAYKAVVKHVAALIVLALLAVAGWRVSSQHAG
ncbi:MAG: hypothetical protein U0132_09160 [Gemmatimonadaceae bacterium]